jgi:hypothetical protein
MVKTFINGQHANLIIVVAKTDERWQKALSLMWWKRQRGLSPRPQAQETGPMPPIPELSSRM